jgi:hypothetical protein
MPRKARGEMHRDEAFALDGRGISCLLLFEADKCTKMCWGFKGCDGVAGLIPDDLMANGIIRWQRFRFFE